jgi:hypothetical protein
MRALTPLLLLLAGCDALTFEPLGSKFSCGGSSGNAVELARVQGQIDWLALTSSHVYYLAGDSMTVGRVPIGGGPGDVFCCSQENPIRIRSAGSDVFYGTQAGKLHRITDADGHDSVIFNGAWPFGVAADATNVYWGTNDGNVMRAAHDGSGATVLYHDQSTPEIMVLGPDALYFLTSQVRPWVQKLPFGASTTTTFNEADSIAYADAGDMAIDGTDLYWTDPSQRAIFHVSTDGSGYYHQVDQQARPTGIAVDSTFVYWTNADDGTVYRQGRAGGSTTDKIASCQGSPSGLVQDGTSVYWANRATGQIMRWAKP